MEMWRVALFLNVLLLSFCFTSANVNVACPNSLFRQKISCGPGQALSSLTWTEDVPNCRKIHVECKNASSSCLEHCEWSTSCGVDKTIETEYVRGVDVLYDMMEEEQVALFLCCHSEDVKTATLDCDGTTNTPLDGTRKQSENSIMVRAMTQQSSGNFPVEAKFCPIVSVPTCPAIKAGIPLEFPDPSILVSPLGLLGLLGLIGLRVRRGDYKCPSPYIIHDYYAFSATAVGYGGVLTIQACGAICKADPQCLYAVHLPPSTCNVKYVPTPNLFPNPGAAIYVKGCIYEVLTALVGQVPCTC